MRNYQQKSIIFPVLMIHYRKIKLKIKEQKIKNINLVQNIYFSLLSSNKRKNNYDSL
jgi:hypothetical protein